MKTSRAIRTASLALLAAAFASGCSRTDRYRLNPSPDMNTLEFTHDEGLNRTTVAIDENLRMLNEEVGRFLLLDRPSRLFYKPIPY